MLALFVKIPTIQRPQKIRRFSADSKYSAALRITLAILRFPHFSAVHITCNKPTTVN